jgi:hypothetical protein
VYGTWLGHPLHLLLTDLPIGLTSAFTLDLVGAAHVGTQLVGCGVISAVPTGLAGAADWGDITDAAPVSCTPPPTPHWRARRRARSAGRHVRACAGGGAARPSVDISAAISCRARRRRRPTATARPPSD